MKKLNIKEIALLKTNPKEYYKKSQKIEKEPAVKHPVTERARNVGQTGKEGPIYEENGKHYYKLSYRDGTEVKYEVTLSEGSGQQEKTEVVEFDIDDELQERLDMMEEHEEEGFFIQQMLEDRISDEYYDKFGDNLDIDAFEVTDDGKIAVPVTYYEEGGTEITGEKIVSVTSPDGMELPFLTDDETTQKMQVTVDGNIDDESLIFDADMAIAEQMGISSENVDVIDVVDSGDGFVTYSVNLTEEDKALDVKHGFENGFMDDLSPEEYERFDLVQSGFFEGEDMYDSEGNTGSGVTQFVKEVAINGKSAESVKDLLDDDMGMTDSSEYQEYGETANKFVDIVRTNEINNADYVTIQKVDNLPDNQGVNKGVVTNQDFNRELFSHNDGNIDINRQLDAGEDSWTILTLREAGNPAGKGLIIDEGETGDTSMSGLDDMVLTAPGQKFERYLIDEQRKIIYQRPYQPGMDRHIWG